MASDCTFCALLGGDNEEDFVYSDPDCVGFLDHRPLFYGHTLVIPRVHIETLVDLPPELVGPYAQAVQKVTQAVWKAMESAGAFVASNNVISQSVPHLHTHVVPRNKGDGLKGFFWPRTKYASDEERHAVAEKIRKVISQT